MKQDYGKAFRIIRAAFGLKQSELAARMDITSGQISLIEAGKRQPSLRLVDSLAATLGIPTALITLLASSPSEMVSKSDEDIGDLARALLRLLVSARELPQHALKFRK